MPASKLSSVAACTGGSPPDCCQPERLSWDEAGRRLAAAHARALASQPTACPACGSARIQPMFTPSGQWDCADCPATFAEGD